MTKQNCTKSGGNVTFERFVSWVYVTGLMQLGLLHENGDQRHLDEDIDQQFMNIIAAGTTVEMMKVLKSKCKGNLSAEEERFLQQAIDDLGDAYGVFAQKVDGLKETVGEILSSSQIVDHVDQLIEAGREKLGN